MAKRGQVRDKARFRALVDQSSDLVLVVDRVGRTMLVSPSVEGLLAAGDRSHSQDACAAANAAPVDFVGALHPADRERFAATLQAAVPGRELAGDFRLAGRHGPLTLQVTVQDLTADPSVEGLVLTAHDVTERLKAQRELEHRALYDELTDLPNRALLADRFEQALLRAQRTGSAVGLLLLDLGRFEEVNDRFGRHHGDELLRQVGPRLATVLREVDTVARLGADQFAVLLRDVRGEKDVSEVANKLLAALSMPFRVGGVDLDVQASIRVVISGEPGPDLVTLVQHANTAMYAAKAQRRGMFAVETSVAGHHAAKPTMVADLRRALERNELVLHYEPKVNASTGHLVGADVLVRWQHPGHGLIFPDNFMPLAERAGLIKPLTSHVLDAALAQARVWIDAGRPLPIAVTLSSHNLFNAGFTDLVADLLAKHAVPAHLLELEMIESAIMVYSQQGCQMLEQLSQLGVRLSWMTSALARPSETTGPI
jgi:diguanylate cyclase (GGDEF)-like protein